MLEDCATYKSADSKLPNEILGEVLGSAIGPVLEDPDKLHRLRYILRLVCRRWKNCVDSDPFIWSVVHINRIFHPTFMTQCIGNTGIDFHIYIDATVHYEWASEDDEYDNHRPVQARAIPDFVTTIFPLFESAFPRASSVSVDADDENDLRSILSVLGSYCGSNISWALLYAANRDGRSSVGRTAQFDQWTSLTSLRFTAVTPAHLPTSLFRNLTKLYLASMWGVFSIRWSHLRAALNAAPHLTILHMVNVDCVGRDEAADITLPNVTQFYLTYGGKIGVEVVALLHMPSLDVFRVEADKRTSMVPLLSRWSKHFGSATQLEIRIAAFEDDLRTILPALHSAAHIDLRRCTVQAKGPVMDQLTDQSFRLPALRVLQLPFDLTRKDVESLVQRAPTIHLADEFMLVTTPVVQLGSHPNFKTYVRWSWDGASFTSDTYEEEEEDSDIAEP
ncbi:hypothetical protein B0H11DRAFT_2228320 [Mycena galericulata]|nr:hypothetical protein B0H11DRAFT_2228320 [Mycena galericulata]